MKDRRCIRLVSLVVCLGLLGALAPVPARAIDRPAVDDIFYHFMPIAWRDSNNDTYRYGDFGGMTASLEYLEQLGVTAVWMNPIFPSPAYHGYQHGPADQLNAWFGTEAEFLNFVQQAHARGIKVFVDLVAYGVSQNNVWFQSAYGNPASSYDDWFAFTNASNTQFLGSSYTTWSGASVTFVHWNLSNPNPKQMVIDWSRHWLDPNGDGDPSDGIDGYRLDHVWAQYGSGPDGWGYNIDDFWTPWKQALLAVNPQVFTFAEQANWGSHGADLLPAHDATMTKPFEFAARDALANEAAAGLYSEMEATLADLPAGRLFVGIIGDHDVDRLTSFLGGSLAKARAAAAILLTQPFPPIIYYGDEIGMLGTKNTGYAGDASDIPMREPFKWNAVAGPPMSNYFAQNSAAYNGRISRNNDGRSVEEQLNVANSLLEEYRTLIAARKAHVALRRGTYHAVPASDTGVWAFVRHTVNDETLIVAINLSGQQRMPALNFTNFTIIGGTTAVQDVMTGQMLTALTDANRAAYSVSIPGYGYRILSAALVPSPPAGNSIDGLNIPTDLGPGSLRATQNNATGLGDNITEFDQLFAKVENQQMRLGVTGNLATDGTGLALFVDTGPGGQNPLDTNIFPSPPSGVAQLDGLVFDSGFAPDYLLWINAWQGTAYVDHFTLATAGGGSKRYLGSTLVNSGTGLLSGGSNTNGMRLALNNTNTAGVTASSADGAATATSGFEMLLPFADYGITTQPTVRLLVVAVRPDGQISNQFLPGLGGGWANLGYVPVDLGTIPGPQYVQIALQTLPGDGNGNGVVDFGDYTLLAGCLSGPAPVALGPGCATFDFDADQDVDLADCAAFQLDYAP